MIRDVRHMTHAQHHDPPLVDPSQRLQSDNRRRRSLRCGDCNDPGRRGRQRMLQGRTNIDRRNPTLTATPSTTPVTAGDNTCHDTDDSELRRPTHLTPRPPPPKPPRVRDPGADNRGLRPRNRAPTRQIPVERRSPHRYLWFTVPAGWKVFEDEPGQFGLAVVAHDGAPLAGRARRRRCRGKLCRVAAAGDRDVGGGDRRVAVAT